MVQLSEVRTTNKRGSIDDPNNMDIYEKHIVPRQPVATPMHNKIPAKIMLYIISKLLHIYRKIQLRC